MTEENNEKTEVYRFGDCVLDADRRELTRAGEPVTTQPKAFELLLYLVRNRSRAVDKDELQDALWPRSIVTETALTRCVMKARRAVGDEFRSNVHRGGTTELVELSADYERIAKVRGEEALAEVHPFTLVPEYLRRSDAERNRNLDLTPREPGKDIDAHSGRRPSSS